MMASSSRISRVAAAPAAAEDDWAELPVGFRFHPTEEELVSYYLMMKLQGNDSLVSQIIPEIDICKYEPWDLPAYSLIKSDDEEWFFFSRPDFKRNNSNRTNRTTEAGYWKITSGEGKIKARDNRTVIGKKRIMTFYIGRHRKAHQKTNWVIHEYYIPANQRDFVLCRLKKNAEKNTTDVATCDEGEPSTDNASDYENQLQPTHDMNIREEYTRAPENLDCFDMARDHMLANGHSDNFNHGFQPAFGANEPNDDFAKFLDSVIVDQDQDLFEETTHTTLLNDSTWAQSLKRVYVKDGGLSSDTDTEAAHQVLQADLFANVAPKPQDNSLQLVTKEHPSTYERRTRIPEPKPIYASKDASSVSADILGINSLQLVIDDYYKNERTRRRSYPQEQGAPAALGKYREQPREPTLQQSKAKEAVRQVAVSAPQKMTSSTTKSSIDKKVAQGNNAEKGMKQTQETTTTTNRKGSFISWQTSPLTNPPSVHIFNTVLGTILFMIFARELVLYGQWC